MKNTKISYTQEKNFYNAQP